MLVQIRLAPESCRAARAFLNRNLARLAEESGLSLITISNYEAGKPSSLRTIMGLQRALEAQGFDLLGADDGRIGVRMREPVRSE